jgi:16S rRNA (adenine(1408)-N(1))-methyltransferase
MRATRKPAKGGLPNAMFVQAAVEALPAEFAGMAGEIRINFPWGSLLRAVAAGESEVLSSLRRIARDRAVMEIVIGADAVRDRAELDRLGVPVPSLERIERDLAPRYEAAGFTLTGCREVAPVEWARFETSWARKLSGNESRRVFMIRFRAT